MFHKLPFLQPRKNASCWSHNRRRSSAQNRRWHTGTASRRCVLSALCSDGMRIPRKRRNHFRTSAAALVLVLCCIFKHRTFFQKHALFVTRQLCHLGRYKGNLYQSLFHDNFMAANGLCFFQLARLEKGKYFLSGLLLR